MHLQETSIQETSIQETSRRLPRAAGRGASATVLSVVLSVALATSAVAQSIGDQRRELEETRGEKEALGEEITDLEQSAEQLDGLIAGLEVQLVEVAFDLADAEMELAWSRRKVVEARLAVSQALLREGQAAKDVDDGFRRAYVQPPGDATGSYLLAADADDAGRRMTLIGSVVDARRDELRQAQELRERSIAADRAAEDVVALAERHRRSVDEIRRHLADLRATHSAARAELDQRLEELRDEAIALAAEEEALVGLIRSLEIEAARAAGTAPSSLIWPASGWVSSEFGIRWGRNHNGIDIAAPTGTQVRSAARGTVRHAGPMGSFGNLVIIDHGGGVATLYAHLHSVGVREGQRVDVNEPIATVGSTGRSTGPHLHFEVRRSGKAVNPRTLLR